MGANQPSTRLAAIFFLSLTIYQFLAFPATAGQLPRRKFLPAGRLQHTEQHHGISTFVLPGANAHAILKEPLHSQAPEFNAGLISISSQLLSRSRRALLHIFEGFQLQGRYVYQGAFKVRHKMLVSVCDWCSTGFWCRHIVWLSRSQSSVPSLSHCTHQWQTKATGCT